MLFLALWAGVALVTGGFPPQRASNGESVSLSWQYHLMLVLRHVQNILGTSHPPCVISAAVWSTWYPKISELPRIWILMYTQSTGPCLNIKTIFPRNGDSHVNLKIRWSWDHLIFNMGIPILVRRHLYIEMPPAPLYHYLEHSWGPFY